MARRELATVTELSKTDRLRRREKDGKQYQRTSAGRAFERWVRDAPTVWLVCRDKGHVWPDDYYQRASRQNDGGWVLRMDCQRVIDQSCGVGRDQYMSDLGYLDPGHPKNGYHYPYGYQYHDPRGAAGGLDQHQRAMIRTELRRRAAAGEDVGSNIGRRRRR